MRTLKAKLWLVIEWVAVMTALSWLLAHAWNLPSSSGRRRRGSGGRRPRLAGAKSPAPARAEMARRAAVST